MGKGGLWGEVKGQSILGGEGFVERFLGYVRGNEEIGEIPTRAAFFGAAEAGAVMRGGVAENRGMRNEGSIWRWGVGI